MSPVNRPGENRLLALLPETERRRLLQHAEKVTAGGRDVIHKTNIPISHVYFPLSGMVSLVMSTKDGATLEVGTIGNEGMVGMPVFFGAERSPMEGIWQVGGDAFRTTTKEFLQHLQQGGALRSVLQLFSQALLNQISQSVVCNRLHPVEQRLCRWLLMTHDRAGADDFPLTQQFVAQMLGVRRPSVTVAAGLLQLRGLIRYNRGNLTVLDRARLEKGSCECYELVRLESERLLGDRL